MSSCIATFLKLPLSAYRHVTLQHVTLMHEAGPPDNLPLLQPFKLQLIQLVGEMLTCVSATNTRSVPWWSLC